MKKSLFFVLFLMILLHQQSWSQCQINLLSQVDVACRGAATGSLHLSGSGGQGPYTFLWSNGYVGTTGTGLSAGTYSITMSDAQACQVVANYTIQQPSTVLQVQAAVVSNYNGQSISCFGAADGAAMATATGGTAPYRFAWANGQTSSTATGLAAGNYSVSVWDANGCFASQTVLMQQPAQVQANISNLGGGNLQASATGGVSAYTFIWNNGSTTSSTNTSIGIPPHCVSVTDVNGCMASTCHNACNYQLQFTNIINPSCFGQATGSLTVQPLGGSPPFTYVWNTSGYTSQTATGLSAGTYSVTVIEAGGCLTVGTYTLTQPLALQASILTLQADTANASTGLLMAQTQGGTGAVSYVWSASAGSQTTAQASGLSAGLHSFTATDVNGCTASASSNLPSVGGCGLGVQMLSLLQPRCAGQSDGQIQVQGQGGTAPYQYLWSNGSTTNQIQNLGVANYFLTITDALGCTVSTVYTLNSPPALQANIQVLQVDNGTANGVLSAQGSGGTPPYAYAWSSTPIQTTALASGLSAGSYTLTLSDANGCTAIQTQVLSSFMAQVEVLRQPCSNQANGQLRVTVLQGQAPFQYRWSTGASTAQIQNLATGQYRVTVSDATGYSTVLTTALNAWSFYLQANQPTQCQGNMGNINVMGLSGTGYNFAWSNGATTSSISALALGCYSVTVSDGICSQHRNACIQQPSQCFGTLTGRVVIDRNQNCAFDSVYYLNSINVQISGNGQQYVAYTNSQGFYSLRLPAGNYTISPVLPALTSYACPTGPASVALTVNANLSQDFFLYRDPVEDLRLSLSPGTARPGFSNFLWINYQNIGDGPVNAQITCRYDSNLVYDSVQLYYPNVQLLQHNAAAHELVFGIQALATSDYLFSTRSLLAYFTLPATVPLGRILRHECWIDPVANDQTPLDNRSTANVTVVGSYDPNDKQDHCAGQLSPSDSNLVYRIRFQNTGTDTAFTVVIRDTLDPSVYELNSLLVLESSHAASFTWEGENVFVATFENIYLPDSNVNEPASNGHLLFRIRRKAHLDCGDVLRNSAAIYFDYNAPVITNTMLTEVYCPTAIRPLAASPLLRLWPNPSTQWAYLQLSPEALGRQYRLSDALGRVWLQGQVQTELLELPTSDLPAGYYYWTIEGFGGASPLIKE